MKNSGHKGANPALEIVLVLLVLGVSAFLFRGSLQQGMQLDEVNRVINVIPLLNPQAQPLHQSLFSLDLFGLELPLMYKEYISTAYIVRFLPLAFFDDYLFGLRVLYWIYFATSAIVLFLVLRARNRYMAVLAPLLMVTAPLYYPEIRIGFADSLHVFFLVIGGYFLTRFIRNPESVFNLFWGLFVLFFAANQMLYFGWVIAGMTLATLILYPEQWLRHASVVRNWVVFLVAATLGMINFLIYNLMNGFPTISIFVNRIFFPEEYNKAPLDYSETAPFLVDIENKLSQIPNFLGPYWKISVAFLLISALILLCFCLRWMMEGKLLEHRCYLLPAVVFSCVLLLILISPKTTRAGHYVYVVPFLQLTILTSFSLLANVVRWRQLILSLPIFLIGVNLIASNRIVSDINRTGGKGYFSPAIFELNDYLVERAIDSRNVVFLTWGLHAQPYFLNKGKFHINQLVFKLIDNATDEDRQLVLKNFLSSSRAQPENDDCLYFPLYAQIRPDVNQSLASLVESYGAVLVLEKAFTERSGEEVILLYRLDHLHELTDKLHEEIAAAPVSEKLRITQYGPIQGEAPLTEDLPVWFIAEGLTPHTKVAFNGILLESVYSVDHVTALIPSKKILQPGTYPLFLFDLKETFRSETVPLQLH